MPGAAESLPHPELRRLAEALRHQPALAERYAGAADLDSLERRLRQDGYAVPRAALEQAVAQSDSTQSALEDGQLDQVQGGNMMYYYTMSFIQARANNPALNDMTLPQWLAKGSPR
ncbi:hypothetical protein [Pseudoroseomonas cervicalis]|uniref:hypothetical protein n=1 Tax=Teichococcus cervicalis TaxID=204525 RepID=UPI00277DB1D2|nr:hypothetical protein [Pseudoroseomonas cervicalis]MDQ1078410.1 hypothetical protein [Pseudoroseomonas cervicalis]